MDTISKGWINVDILARLLKRFNIAVTPLINNAGFFENLIRPVTQVDELLKTYKCGLDSEDLSGGPGAYITYYTVPSGKRWNLLRAHVSATAASSTMGILRYGDTTYMPLEAGGTSTRNLGFTPGQVVLNEGDIIWRTETGNGADSSETLMIDYSEEDSFAP